jgi:hypothetical protein
MDWKIYYGDGETFSSEDGKPEEIPESKRFNVMVCAVTNLELTGRDCWNQSDFYIYRTDQGWIPVDWTGLLDQMLHCTHLISAVLQGRTCETQRFKAILKRSKTDPGLPIKSASQKRERSSQAYGTPKK